MIEDMVNIESFDYDSLSQTFLSIPAHERFLFFHVIHNQLDTVTFWLLFRDCWSMSESLYRDKEIITKLLNKARTSPKSVERFECMSTEEKAVLSNLPDVVPIYRGCCESNKKGWSYTLDKEKAIWFANRLPIDGKPLLIEAEVKKEYIILYLECREEAEVIVNPKHILTSKIHELPEVQLDRNTLLTHLVQSGAMSL